MNATRLTILLGCLAVCWTAPVELHAQRTTSAATTMRTWQQASQGLSPNAALALYRMQNVGHPTQGASTLRRPSPYPSTTLYSTPYYAVTTWRAVPQRPTSYYPTANNPSPDVPQTQKPFADVRTPPNAFQRYWPYLLEAREDPRTGLIIWQLP